MDFIYINVFDDGGKINIEVINRYESDKPFLYRDVLPLQFEGGHVVLKRVVKNDSPLKGFHLPFLSIPANNCIIRYYY